MPTSNNVGQVTLAVIGGSGLSAIPGLGDPSGLLVTTPYRQTPVQLWKYQAGSTGILFLPRHGPDHQLAPHLINYQANLWALKHAGADCIFAINTVGGINTAMQPGAICLPDQIIDYTWGRNSTYCMHPGDHIPHLDFTCPFDAGLNQIILESALSINTRLLKGGVYGCTQGPRLETAAEISRMARDGCDIVGMTGMPEAILARELDLPYAMLALIVNKAAGLDDKALDFEAMKIVSSKGITLIGQLLLAALPALPDWFSARMAANSIQLHP